ncbi:MAG: hypothetical protein PHF50_04155 [Patescibacteria group bacterium]|nr:hypothetical protein [Patescibacteria group bacterium]
MAGQLRESGGGLTVTTSGRLNHNGAYLIFFFSAQSLLSTLPSIEAIVSAHDNKATIIVNYRPEVLNG